MRSNDIVEAAKIAHRRFWRATSQESIGDKQATSVTVAWQRSVASSNVQCEVPVTEDLNDKIDVVDFSTATAYEMKVSGKNPHHEFYKDIFKVLIYNEHHDKKLERLVFITEKDGAGRLSKGLGKAITSLLVQYNLRVRIVAI
jgi:hypothetical protein